MTLAETEWLLGAAINLLVCFLSPKTLTDLKKKNRLPGAGRSVPPAPLAQGGKVTAAHAESQGGQGTATPRLRG